MRTFFHYVLTRFNIRYAESAFLASDAWLRERLHLFRHFALTSMRAQSVPPDEWLIICDRRSPDWLRDELDSLLRPPERAVWIDAPFNESVASELVADSRARYLITTRLDNDDAVARDFVETIQKAFKDQDFEFVNLVRGAQYQNGRFYNRSDPANAFISLVERRGGQPPRTVWIDQHQRLDRYGPIRQVATRHPMWLQNIHGGNLQNTVHGIRVPAAAVVPHFEIDVARETSSPVLLAADRLRTALLLGLRVIRKPSRIKWLVKVLRS